MWSECSSPMPYDPSACQRTTGMWQGSHSSSTCLRNGYLVFEFLLNVPPLFLAERDCIRFEKNHKGDEDEEMFLLVKHLLYVSTYTCTHEHVHTHTQIHPLTKSKQGRKIYYLHKQLSAAIPCYLVSDNILLTLDPGSALSSPRPHPVNLHCSTHSLTGSVPVANPDQYTGLGLMKQTPL